MFCRRCSQRLQPLTHLALVSPSSPVRSWLLRPAMARCGSSLRKRLKKLEDREQTVYEHVGKNTRRAERIYVWGYAGTGALGKT